LCPAVALSHQDGHHSAVALLLKAALIQVSDNRLLGASGFKLNGCCLQYWNINYFYLYIYCLKKETIAHLLVFLWVWDT